jgi:MFS family permease
MSAMFRSLSIRNYRLWFIGALISNVGAWMQATAQNWVVLTELTSGDAIAVGVTMALQFGPQLLLVPISGLIADRFDRKRVLIVTQSSLGLLALGLGALLLSGYGELWHLFAFALMLGIVNAIDTPARQAFVSDLVAHNQLSNAVALNSASFNTARMIGPAVAGLLIAVVGSGWVFVMNGASFAAMLLALFAIKIDPVKRRMGGPQVRQAGQLVAGFRYVLGRKDLMVVFAIVFLMGAFGMNFPIVSSTMALEFGRGAGEYGLLSSILAVGSLVGALLAARRRDARLRVVIIAAGGFGVACIVSALMPTFWSFAISLMLMGFTTVTLLTTANGFVQTTTEPALRGRVLALYLAVLMGGTPLGAPIVGAVSDAFGARWTLGVAAIAGMSAFTIGMVWLFRERQLRFHFGRRGRVRVTHLGRPRVDDDPARQTETLTASIEVLRRGPILIAPSDSAPQEVPSAEQMTGPIEQPNRAAEEG